jgi:hypothetical protein
MGEFTPTSFHPGKLIDTLQQTLHLISSDVKPSLQFVYRKDFPISIQSRVSIPSNSTNNYQSLKPEHAFCKPQFPHPPTPNAMPSSDVTSYSLSI